MNLFKNTTPWIVPAITSLKSAIIENNNLDDAFADNKRKEDCLAQILEFIEVPDPTKGRDYAILFVCDNRHYIRACMNAKCIAEYERHSKKHQFNVKLSRLKGGLICIKDFVVRPNNARNDFYLKITRFEFIAAEGSAPFVSTKSIIESKEVQHILKLIEWKLQEEENEERITDLLEAVEEGEEENLKNDLEASQGTVPTPTNPPRRGVIRSLTEEDCLISPSQEEALTRISEVGWNFSPATPTPVTLTPRTPYHQPGSSNQSATSPVDKEAGNSQPSSNIIGRILSPRLNMQQQKRSEETIDVDGGEDEDATTREGTPEEDLGADLDSGSSTEEDNTEVQIEYDEPLLEEDEGEDEEVLSMPFYRRTENKEGGDGEEEDAVVFTEDDEEEITISPVHRSRQKEKEPSQEWLPPYQNMDLDNSFEVYTQAPDLMQSPLLAMSYASDEDFQQRSRRKRKAFSPLPAELSQLFRTPENTQQRSHERRTPATTSRQQRRLARSRSPTPNDDALLSASLAQLMEDATQKIAESPRRQSTTTTTPSRGRSQLSRRQSEQQEQQEQEREDYSYYSVPSMEEESERSEENSNSEEASVDTQPEQHRMRVNYSSWLGFGSRSTAPRKK